MLVVDTDDGSGTCLETSCFLFFILAHPPKNKLGFQPESANVLESHAHGKEFKVYYVGVEPTECPLLYAFLSKWVLERTVAVTFNVKDPPVSIIWVPKLVSHHSEN